MKIGCDGARFHSTSHCPQSSPDSPPSHPEHLRAAHRIDLNLTKDFLLPLHSYQVVCFYRRRWLVPLILFVFAMVGGCKERHSRSSMSDVIAL